MIADQEKIEKRLAALTAVQNIAQELTSELNPARLILKILNAAVQVVNATTGSLLLWDPETDELVFVVTEEKELLNYRMPANKGIAGWVFTHCEPLIVGDVTQDGRHYDGVDMDMDFQTHSLIAVPLMNATEKIGIIEAVNKKSGGQFDQEDQDILSALAAQATTAIINARLYQELEAEKNRILELQDQERRKLARDLHDGPAQTLANIIMSIDFILKLHEREPAKLPEELKKLRETVQKTLAQVRNAMFELRPLALETEGLKEALRIYAERLAQTESFQIHLDIRNLDERLPPKVEELCFAIIQEAVGNIKKHARARNTWIGVERQAQKLFVAVRDDGKGFDVMHTEQGYGRRGSLGLRNMKERSEMLGAQYRIESVPGRGTLVSLIVPLSTIAAANSSATSTAPEPLPQNGRRKGTGPLVWPGDPVPNSTLPRKKGTGPLIDEP